MSINFISVINSAIDIISDINRDINRDINAINNDIDTIGRDINAIRKEIDAIDNNARFYTSKEEQKYDRQKYIERKCLEQARIECRKEYLEQEKADGRCIQEIMDCLVDIYDDIQNSRIDATKFNEYVSCIEGCINNLTFTLLPFTRHYLNHAISEVKRVATKSKELGNGR